MGLWVMYPKVRAVTLKRVSPVIGLPISLRGVVIVMIPFDVLIVPFSTFSFG
jgi:hypothetical protein